ncbi:MAG: hypothetical protein ACOC4G_10840 [Bacillota bacterium]
MITTREVLEITEKSMGHKALVEKFNYYSNHCNDPQVKNLLDQHQQILQQHHQTLMNFLNNGQNNSQNYSQNVNRQQNRL